MLRLNTNVDFLDYSLMHTIKNLSNVSQFIEKTLGGVEYFIDNTINIGNLCKYTIYFR